MYIFLILILLLLSGIASASEVAFFSLNSKDIEKIQNFKPNVFIKISKLLKQPDKLLATILIFNNVVNIAIVLICSYFINNIIMLKMSPFLNYIVEFFGITAVLLLFGEIFPKIFANAFNVKFAEILCIPITFVQKLFYPLVIIFQKSVYIVNKNIYSSEKVSLNDISYAIDIVDMDSKQNKQILKKVVNFGNIEAHEIMKSRVDVVCADLNMSFLHLIELVNTNQYSRLPVKSGNSDNIEGILYVKDLVLQINKSDFQWQKLIRPAYFIPENMKIDNLLDQFRKKKIHMAIVSDEYGGFCGIVTLEDVIEQIVGEINDEFDEPEEMIKKIEKDKYLIDGKLLLQDLINFLGLPATYFDNYEDIETVAGLLLEINSDFPKEKQIIHFKKLVFTVEKISKVRIEKIIIENNQPNINE